MYKCERCGQFKPFEGCRCIPFQVFSEESGEWETVHALDMGEAAEFSGKEYFSGEPISDGDSVTFVVRHPRGDVKQLTVVASYSVDYDAYEDSEITLNPPEYIDETP